MLADLLGAALGEMPGQFVVGESAPASPAAVWFGPVWFGPVWSGAVWSGAVWPGAAWPGPVCSGAAWPGAVACPPEGALAPEPGTVTAGRWSDADAATRALCAGRVI